MFVGVAFACISLKRFDEAVAASKRALRQNDRFAPAFRCLAAALALLGREQEARAAADQLLELEPGFRISEFLSRSRRYQPDHFIKGLREAGLAD